MRRVSILAVILWLLSGQGASHADPAPAEIRFAFVGSLESPEWRGVQLGIDEANVLGEFTGRRYRVDPVTSSNFGGAPVPVLAALDTAALEDLVGIQDRAPVLNLTVASDDLRQRCRSHLFHIIPSATMTQVAENQWRQAHGELVVAGKAVEQTKVEARAWHQDFRKFAARDLNKRYSKAHGEPMGDGAWAGWIAARLLAEAVTRVGSDEPEQLLAFLRENLEIDGQKGVPHTFHSSGQLRQPLLLVSSGKLLGEAPVRGVAEFEDLDSLGMPSCSDTEEP